RGALGAPRRSFLVGAPRRRQGDGGAGERGRAHPRISGSGTSGPLRPRHGPAGARRSRLEGGRMIPLLPPGLEEVLAPILLAMQVWVFVYFAAITTITLLVGWLGLRTMRITARLGSAAPLTDLFERDVHKPVSILVPAYNESGSIVESVRSF